MKFFEGLSFDTKACASQLEEFETLLNTKGELSERNDILPLFNRSPSLSGLIGMNWPGMSMPNRIAFEFDIFGNYRADLALGLFKENDKRNAFLFIEFEDARPNSIFRQVNRSKRDWASRFEHGFSQLIDWSYALDDAEKSDTFEDRFGSRRIRYEMLLVIGRSQYLTPQDLRRIEWRVDNVQVDGHRIYVSTYDDLLEDLSYRFEVLQSQSSNLPDSD